MLLSPKVHINFRLNRRCIEGAVRGALWMEPEAARIDMLRIDKKRLGQLTI
jgi:hypothetical protein